MSNFINHPMTKLISGYMLSTALMNDLKRTCNLESANLSFMRISNSVGSQVQEKLLKHICEKNQCTEVCPVYMARENKSEPCPYKEDGSKMRIFLTNEIQKVMDSLN